MEQPIRVLFVEDDPEMIAIYTENFAAPEFQTGSASNGTEALNLLQASETKFDIVVTDNYMPQMDGLTLLSRIHELYPKLKVIVVTGYGNWGNYVNAYNLGVCRFLDKPVKMNDLKTIIREVMK